MRGITDATKEREQFKVSGIRFVWIPGKEVFNEFVLQNRISGSLALAAIDVTHMLFSLE